MRPFALLLCLLGTAAAQTSTPSVPTSIPTTGDFSQLPTYVVGAGLETDPSGIMVTLGIRIGQSNLYSWTTLDTPYQQISSAAKTGSQISASVRTGAAYVAAHKGACFLYFIGDGGISSVSGAATLGAFSAGGGMLCTSKKAPGLYFGPIVSATKTSASTATPAAKFWMAWSF